MKLEMNQNKTPAFKHANPMETILKSLPLLFPVSGIGLIVSVFVRGLTISSQGLAPSSSSLGLILLGTASLAASFYVFYVWEAQKIGRFDIKSFFGYQLIGAILGVIIAIAFTLFSSGSKWEERRSLLVEQGYEHVERETTDGEILHYAEKDGKAYYITIEQEGNELYFSPEETEKKQKNERYKLK